MLVPGQTRSEISFRRVQVIERGVVADKLPALYIADRVEVSPRLRIRRAVLVLFTITFKVSVKMYTRTVTQTLYFGELQKRKD